ncbi:MULTISPECIES: protein phosphatase 2C domain-containing protein [Streptomycetaceae]|nr:MULTISPECIES: protein phosphatase 2C domain-containing protein [Streptomycetaceae]MYS57668.1 hypothetical protein [Streptomyces sp. SID5468]CCB73279.1 conserved protein of unknown function [Streptantibioticus cattleyicolor NRRL 8057 = DSM 46488]
MTTARAQTVTTATATRQGSRPCNADAAAVHRVPGTRLIGAAVVDGIGSNPAVARLAEIAAEVIARVAPRKTPVLGILAAAELVAAPADRNPIDPDAVAVAAVAEPGRRTGIAWTGDARAYGWDGTTLTQLTTDQTVGEYLRANSGGGGPVELLAQAHDNWLRASLGRSSISTVHTVGTDARLVLLTSDGVHDHIPHKVLEALVREHAENAQALVEAVVEVAEPDETGYRDDATAVVLVTTTTA